MLATEFNSDLIRRYDVNGPRYTSYPTADQFREGHWIDQYRSAVARTSNPSLSLYLHVPFCSKICFYCACTKINTANVKRADSYVQRLTHEIALQSELIDRPHKVEQLHFGGGTPTFLNDEQFATLFASMHSYFNLSADSSRDFSIEIDPRNLAPARIAALAKLGINRLSIGIQDFDPAVQLAVNRVQTVEETSAVIDQARSSGIDSINIDLINGLPKQSLDGFSRTLEKVVELQPDRLSLYSYAHLPQRFKSQRQINAEDLPLAPLKLKLLETAVNLLAGAGYSYIGMDHFAKDTDSLVRAQQSGTLQRNFQGYTTHGHCQLVGLGLSSIGNVGNLYVQNAKKLHDYYASIDAGSLAVVRGCAATDRDLVVRRVIHDLMCRFAVDFEQFYATVGADFRTFFAAQWTRLEMFEAQGLLTLDTDALRVTDQGRFLVRVICMAFDTYLGQKSTQFSKAI